MGVPPAALANTKPAFGFPSESEGGSEGGLRWVRKGEQVWLIPHYGAYGSHSALGGMYRLNFDNALREGNDQAWKMKNDPGVMALMHQRYAPLKAARLQVRSSGPDAGDAVNEFYESLLKQGSMYYWMRQVLLESAWYGRYGVQLAFDQQTYDYKPISVNGVPVKGVSHWTPVLGDKILWTYDFIPCIRIHWLDVPKWKSRGWEVRNERGEQDDRFTRQNMWSEAGPVVMLERPEHRKQFAFSFFEVQDTDFAKPSEAAQVRGVGLRHYIYWAWNLRNQLLAWWMDYVEEFSGGGYILVGYASGNDEAKKAAEAQFAQPGRKVIFLPMIASQNERLTEQVTRLEVSAATTENFWKLADEWFMRDICLMILGQTMSTRPSSTGIGQGASELHGEVRSDITKADMERESVPFTQDILPRLKELNDPTGRYVLEAQYVPNTEDNGDKIEQTHKAWTMGMGVPEKHLQALVGTGKTKPGERVLRNPQIVQQEQAAMMAGGMNTVEQDDAAGNDPVTRLQVEQTFQDLVGQRGRGVRLDEMRAALSMAGMDEQKQLHAIANVVEGGKIREVEDGQGVILLPTDADPRGLSPYGNKQAYGRRVEWQEEQTKIGTTRWVNPENPNSIRYTPPETRDAQTVDRGGDKEEQVKGWMKAAGGSGRGSGADLAMMPGKGIATGGIEATTDRLIAEGGASLAGGGTLEHINHMDRRMNKFQVLQFAARHGMQVKANTSKVRALAYVEWLLRAKAPKLSPYGNGPNQAAGGMNPNQAAAPAAKGADAGSVGPASVPNQGEAGGPQIGKAAPAKLKDLHVDPSRFQYKSGKNPKTGAGDDLEGVKYKPELAGAVLTWQDPEHNREYVINGHHRYDLADRSGAEEINRIRISAKDAGEARTIGALANIAEGKGTATDAAKIFRETGMTLEQAQAAGIPEKGSLLKDGMSLASLEDGIFQRVAMGTVSEGRGKAIAEGTADHTAQKAVMDVIDKTEAKGKKQIPDAVARQMALEAGMSAKISTDKEDLFGSFTDEESTFVERAQLKAYIESQLGLDRNTFKMGSSAKRGAKLGEVGASTLDTEANAKAAGETEALLDRFKRTVNLKGPLADHVAEVAAEMKKNPRRAASIKQEALSKVKGILGDELSTGSMGTNLGGPAGSGNTPMGTDSQPATLGEDAAPGGSNDQDGQGIPGNAEPADHLDQAGTGGQEVSPPADSPMDQGSKATAGTGDSPDAGDDIQQLRKLAIPGRLTPEQEARLEAWDDQRLEAENAAKRPGQRQRFLEEAHNANMRQYKPGHPINKNSWVEEAKTFAVTKASDPEYKNAFPGKFREFGEAYAEHFDKVMGGNANEVQGQPGDASHANQEGNAKEGAGGGAPTADDTQSGNPSPYGDKETGATVADNYRDMLYKQLGGDTASGSYGNVEGMHRIYKPAMERLEGGGWHTSQQLAKELNPASRGGIQDPLGSVARQMQDMNKAGHVQLAWDHTGLPHYAKAGEELPGHLRKDPGETGAGNLADLVGKQVMTPDGRLIEVKQNEDGSYNLGAGRESMNLFEAQDFLKGAEATPDLFDQGGGDAGTESGGGQGLELPKKPLDEKTKASKQRVADAMFSEAMNRPKQGDMFGGAAPDEQGGLFGRKQEEPQAGKPSSGMPEQYETMEAALVGGHEHGDNAKNPHIKTSPKSDAFALGAYLKSKGEKINPDSFRKSRGDTYKHGGKLYRVDGHDVTDITPADQGADRAQANLPIDKRGGGNLDQQIDRWKKEEAGKAKEKRTADTAKRKEDKANARELFEAHGDSLIKSTAEKSGKSEKEVRQFLDRMVKWEPSKAVAMLSKWRDEKAMETAGQEEKPAENTKVDPEQEKAAKWKAIVDEEAGKIKPHIDRKIKNADTLKRKADLALDMLHGEGPDVKEVLAGHLRENHPEVYEFIRNNKAMQTHYAYSFAQAHFKTPAREKVEGSSNSNELLQQAAKHRLYGENYDRLVAEAAGTLERHIGNGSMERYAAGELKRHLDRVTKQKGGGDGSVRPDERETGQGANGGSDASRNRRPGGPGAGGSDTQAGETDQKAATVDRLHRLYEGAASIPHGQLDKAFDDHAFDINGLEKAGYVDLMKKMGLPVTASMTKAKMRQTFIDTVKMRQGMVQRADMVNPPDSKKKAKVEKHETPEFKNWFGKSQVVDEAGKPKMVFHGTRRPDRVGDAFDPKRATSGPMAFFTDDPDIASKYAEGKADTSLQAPDDYAGWFKHKPEGFKSEVDIDRAWHFLSPEKRKELAEKLPHVVNHDQDGNEMEGYRLGGEDEYGLSDKGHWDYHVKQARGNYLQAAKEIWLNSAALYNSEHEFLDVLKTAGMDNVRLDDPNAAYPGVYPVHLSIQNPLDTANIPDEVHEALHQAGKRKRGKTGSGADQWDKNYVSGQEWLERLRSDKENGTTHAWTSIPDWVTETLKKHGYDGIKDTGGKNGGPGHHVWIPFESGQIKSAYGNKGSYDRNNKKLHFGKR